MHRSAHVDTFARDHLPPPDEWPELLFDLPELRYPERLNCAAELLGHAAADRPVFRTPAGPPGRTAICAHTSTGSRTCSPATSAWSPATGCCCAAPPRRGSLPVGWPC